jgi:hypothetical protein
MYHKNNNTKEDNYFCCYYVCYCICLSTGLIGNANALTRYYNCTTRVANKNGTLSLQNIENCYDQVYKGAEQAEKDEASLKTSD